MDAERKEGIPCPAPLTLVGDCHGAYIPKIDHCLVGKRLETVAKKEANRILGRHREYVPFCDMGKMCWFKLPKVGVDERVTIST